MLRSLRARLAFLFVGTLLLAVIAGVVVSACTSPTAVTRPRPRCDAGRGVASYYRGAFTRTFGKAREPASGKMRSSEFNQATAAKLYYGGPKLFPAPGAPRPSEGSIPT